MSEPLIDPKRTKELIEKWSKVVGLDDPTKPPKLNTVVLYEAQERWFRDPTKSIVQENSKIDS